MALVETSVDGRVGLCRLNRPESRNALSPELMEQLADALAEFDADRVGCGGAVRPGAHASALMPVAARPMISFWICDVPSYSVVTRASRR